MGKTLHKVKGQKPIQSKTEAPARAFIPHREKVVTELGVALHMAVKRGDLEQIENLVGMGANPNGLEYGDGDSTRPLVTAIRYGQYDAAKLLLQLGAKPDSAYVCDYASDFSLLIAAGAGKVKLVNLLLEYGADPNNVNFGERVPLVLAAEKGHFEVVEALLNAGADPNAKHGLSAEKALDAALRIYDYRMARLLIEKGATVSEEHLARFPKYGNDYRQGVLVQYDDGSEWTYPPNEAATKFAKFLESRGYTLPSLQC